MVKFNKSIDFLKNVKGNRNLNFSNFERFNSVLSYLELPFFFDNDSNKFYRFEGSIYNFNYEITYRNFSVDLNLGLKVKTKLLMSLFMQLPSAKHTYDRKFSSKTSFLLKNGFLISNFKKSQQNLLNFSDISLSLLAHQNKFNRAVEFNMLDVDTFISTINSNWIDVNKMDSNFFGHSLRSLIVVNDNLRTFSFLVSSLDGFRVLHPQFFNKYLYFKKAYNNLKQLYISSYFNLVFNKNYYLFFYDSFIKISDSFLFKNLNYFFIYNYNLKFLFFMFLNYKNFLFNGLFLSKYLKYILLFLNYKNFFNSISMRNFDNRSKMSLKAISLRIVRYFINLFNNLEKHNFKTLLNLNKSFFYNSKRKIKKYLSTSVLSPLSYSHILLHSYKKCYHRYPIHYQPSEIFSAVSRLGFSDTSISYMTSFYKFKTFHYAEKSIGSYYGFLKFFSDFILSFFKRNFVNSVLINNYYNPKYLLFRYFTTFKLFFPFLFKRWFLSNLNMTSDDLVLISNYLNYSLLTKNYFSLKTNRNKRYKKANLKSKFTKTSKILNLSASKLYKQKLRFFSTLTPKNLKGLVNYFSPSLFSNLNYFDCNVFFININKVLNFNRVNVSIYFFYLLSCLTFNLKFFNQSFFVNNSFFIIDYKLLAFFELLKYNIISSFFDNDAISPILRYTDFNIKVDFYTFIILKRFLEYFRRFKYNEYLSYNNLSVYNYFSKSTDDFSFLPSFFDFKRGVFFNKYLIFKIYNKSLNGYISNTLVNKSFISIPFFKFLILLLSVKKIFNLFFYFLFIYIISNVNYFSYKSLFWSNRDLQFFDLYSLDKLSVILKKKNVLYDMFSFISRKWLYQYYINSYKFYGSNIIDSFLCNNKISLFNNVINFLLVDYIDYIVLTKFLELQSYKLEDFIDFLKKMILRSYFSFINLSDNNFLFNIFFFKQKLDFFLWSVYNFAFIKNYNAYYLTDFIIFMRKLKIDNYIKSAALKFSNFVLISDSFLNISNFFFMYLLARDVTLKISTRLFFFSYFYKVYFIYIILNYFKMIQFYKAKLLAFQLKYYKVFNSFFNSNFIYLI